MGSRRWHTTAVVFRDWLQAARPLAQANLAAPLLFGEALAYAVHARFSWEMLAAVAVWGVLDQLFIVFANDYADRDHDRGGSDKTPFSGGSGVIPEGKISAASLKRAAILAYGSLGILSIAIAVLGSWWMILLWTTAGALLWLYSYPPLRLSYRGGGEWLQGLGVGGVLPLVGFVAQAGTLDAFPWSVLAATFTLAFAGNVATALPDLSADRRANKRTWAVRMGRARAAWACTGLTAIAMYLAIIVGAPGAIAFAVVLLLPNLRFDPRSRKHAVRFVFFQGAASQALLLTWAWFLVRESSVG